MREKREGRARRETARSLASMLIHVSPSSIYKIKSNANLNIEEGEKKCKREKVTSKLVEKM